VAGNRYGTVRIWDLDGEEIGTLKGHMSDVWAIAFSPNGKTLAAADTDWKKPGTIKLWNTETWREGRPLPCPTEILAIAWSAKGDQAAVGCWDKIVRVYAVRP
jgi:WD40 repeat protein